MSLFLTVCDSHGADGDSAAGTWTEAKDSPSLMAASINHEATHHHDHTYTPLHPRAIYCIAILETFKQIATEFP